MLYIKLPIIIIQQDRRAVAWCNAFVAPSPVHLLFRNCPVQLQRQGKECQIDNSMFGGTSQGVSCFFCDLFQQKCYGSYCCQPGQKERAIQLAQEILAVAATVEGIAEDAVIKHEVKALLAEWEK